jgi:cell wall-associated NlpC family hydrolase
VAFREAARSGDLAFFDNEEGRITHVGIMLGTSSIIHASGQVRIDEIDHYGIMNKEEKQYSHKLRIIKRLAA